MQISIHGRILLAYLLCHLAHILFGFLDKLLDFVVYILDTESLLLELFYFPTQYLILLSEALGVDTHLNKYSNPRVIQIELKIK